MSAYKNLQNKIVSVEECRQFIDQVKKNAGKVVFTNGCFDILHLGHVSYLSRAADFGDAMVVGLNTDASVSRLKGPERPLQSEDSRSMVMAALEFVDKVVLFDDDTPLELISALLPDVLVKGADYSVDDIVGADVVLKNGGEVKTIDLVEGQSSTNVINKMLK